MGNLYESERLALQLQHKEIETNLHTLQEDIRAVEGRRVLRSTPTVDRTVPDEMIDREIALIVSKSDIQRRLGRVENIIRALTSNTDIIDLTEENPLPFKKPEVTDTTLAPSVKPEIIDLTGDLEDPLQTLQPEQHEAEPSQSGSLRRSSRRKRKISTSCTGCLEEFEPWKVFPGQCGHYFCSDCLGRMFLGAIEDEQLYPPRCCGKPVNVKTLVGILKDDEIQQFEEKVIEYSDPDRLYCANPKCSTYIPKTKIAKELGTCPSCKQKTHTLCKAKAHPKVDCPADKALQQVLKVAAKNKWRRCEKCRAMISRIDGCSQIRCRCGHQFCYVCGSFKNCTGHH